MEFSYPFFYLRFSKKEDHFEKLSIGWSRRSIGDYIMMHSLKAAN